MAGNLRCLKALGKFEHSHVKAERLHGRLYCLFRGERRTQFSSHLKVFTELSQQSKCIYFVASHSAWRHSFKALCFTVGTGVERMKFIALRFFSARLDFRQRCRYRVCGEIYMAWVNLCWNPAVYLILNRLNSMLGAVKGIFRVESFNLNGN